MQLIEAATLDRKSGEADLSRRAVEGSAVLRTSPGNAEYPTQPVPKGRDNLLPGTGVPGRIPRKSSPEQGRHNGHL